MKFSIEDINIVNGAYVRHVDALGSQGTHLKLVQINSKWRTDVLLEAI